MGETACSGSSFTQLGTIIFVLSRFLTYAGSLAGPLRGQHPYTPYVEIQRDSLNPSQDVFFLGKMYCIKSEIALGCNSANAIESLGLKRNFAIAGEPG